VLRLDRRERFGQLRHSEGQMRCLQGMMALDPEKKPGKMVPLLLRQASEKRNAEKALALYQMARKADLKLDPRQVVGVIMTMVQADQPKEAFKIAIEHAQHTRIPYEQLGLLIDSLSKKPSLVDEAYYEVEKMHEAKGTVPIQAANAIIEASARMGDLDRAFATWAEFGRFGLESDVGTYNSLLHTCVKTRELASARKLLNRMSAAAIEPDSFTYQYRTALCVMDNNGQAASEMIQECVARGITPTPQSYVTLINWHLRQGRDIVAAGKKAQEVIEAMAKYHQVTETLTNRVRGALEGKRPDGNKRPDGRRRRENPPAS